ELENLVVQRTASLNEQIERRIEFTRALVHELKTPLTAILSSSEILSEKVSDKLLLGFISNINKSSSTLNNRVDELLDMAKSEIGVLNVSRKKINPLTLLQCTVEEITPLANKKGQTIFLEMLETLPDIYGDFERLNQVLLNLIDNAIKFNRKKGLIKVSAIKQDTLIVFGVSDQGKGITNGESEKIFMPYYRLTRDRERSNGLGLGLALAKSLVELHGGNMWVKNNIDNGCTFYFSIPVNNLAGKERLET
ncbi:MAG: HAMP domain-containing sensor histidine kinase, partial [Dehalococcoidales bacterium]|nr:HAMP domain-containing sensor histidine kinase [Dehalococcoidales bacterium]